MSDQGLSIFDHEPDNSADEPTQVIDRDGAEQGTQKTAQKVAEKPAREARRVQAPQRPQPRPAQPAGPTGRRSRAPGRSRDPAARRAAARPCRPCVAAATTPPPSTSTCAP